MLTVCVSSANGYLHLEVTFLCFLVFKSSKKDELPRQILEHKAEKRQNIFFRKRRNNILANCAFLKYFCTFFLIETIK
jgi:hypothetical protein